MTVRVLSLMLTIAVTFSCHTTTGARSDAISAPAEFTLVLLRSTHEPAADATGEVFRAHREFLEADVAIGRTPLVGQIVGAAARPGEDSVAGTLAGLLVFDSADPDVAAAHFARDPAVAKGYFQPEYVPLETLNLVRRVPAAIETRRARAASAVHESARPDLATYTICIAPDGYEAARAFRSDVVGRHVVLLGRLGAPLTDGLFAITSLSRPEALLTRVAAAQDIDTSDWMVRTWISSPALIDVVGAALSAEEVAVEVVGPHSGVGHEALGVDPAGPR